MLIVTRNEQRLLTSELAVFGLIGRHRRPGWPSLAAGVAVIGLVGRLWPGWLSSAAGVAIIGLVGHLWPGWPSLAAGVAIIGLE